MVGSLLDAYNLICGKVEPAATPVEEGGTASASLLDSYDRQAGSLDRAGSVEEASAPASRGPAPQRPGASSGDRDLAPASHGPAPQMPGATVAQVSTTADSLLEAYVALDAPRPVPAPGKRKSFESAADERKSKADHEAARLFDMLPHGVLPVVGGAGSSLVAALQTYRAAGIQFLAQRGGKTGDKTTKTRLFLENFMTVMNSEGRSRADLFPITQTDAMFAAGRMGEVMSPTAYARYAPALDFLNTIQPTSCPLIVGYKPEALPVRIPRRPAPDGAGKARGTPSPASLLHLSNYVDSPPSDISEAIREKAREVYVGALFCLRGADLRGAKMLEHEDDSIVRVMIDDDKNGRKDVECLSHAISLSTGEPLPWFPSFRDSRMGLPFVVTDFEGPSVLSSHRMRLDGEGRYTYCAERKAYDAFVAVQPLAWGLSQQQLHEGQLQGTHALRNLGGDITEQLGWEEKTANVVGDWASPRKAAAGGEAAPPSTRSGGRKRPCSAAMGTRQRHYNPMSPKQQLRVRGLFLHAIADGLKEYGHDNIVADTTWMDIFPPVESAPEALRQYYRVGIAPE